VKKTWLIAPAAILIATAACGNQGARNEDGSAPQTRSQDGPLLDPTAVNPVDLQETVSDERVRRFYHERNWQAAWRSDTAPDLIEALRGAARHGLNPADYIGPFERAGSPAAREAALTKAALDLADDLGDGKADPGKIFPIYTLPRPTLDVVAGLRQAVAENRAGEWLAGLAPADAEYRALSEAYLHYARRAAGGTDEIIESGELIREGDIDPRVSQIVEVLRTNGYLRGGAQQQPGSEQDPGSRYTGAIAEAVRRMQDDFGIAADGVVGPETLQVLNTGSDERARALAVNLERLRWLERTPPPTRIDVNVAAAALDYYRDGQHRDSRRVVVGQPDWETPQLGSPIYRLVANPTWTVPKSIEREEIQGRGEGYLRRNNMVRRDGWVVQLPGPGNALGEVKFDMRNDHAIYLHDTPAKHLFEGNRRHRSHGCVRVEDALEFARILARAGGVEGEFERALASGEETFVNLEDNIPVRLLYRTAFTDRAGEVMFRIDAYGWDDRVAEALGYETRQSPRSQRHVSDIGP
jgi:murein L,D-transpeptidase YcbB/YkuD